MDFIFDVLFIFAILISKSIQVKGAMSYRQPRLSLAETRSSYNFRNINGHPGTYSFGFDVQDPSGNNQFRSEERYPNGTVIGSYGYVDGAGRPHRYKYTADIRGYRVSRIRSPEYSSNYKSTPSPMNALEPEITWTRPKTPGKKKTKEWHQENRAENSLTRDRSRQYYFRSSKEPISYRLY